MADYYCDHGAYPAYAATPTWNTAQEGDGKATGLATPATAFISFSAVPSSGTVSVCGVSVSTTGVIGAASADAAANALATNINATTTTVGSGVASGTPQLRNLLFARGPAGGAPAGTCQVMSRCGSADFNYATTASWLIATTLNNVSSAGADHQFVGGASGVWGYLINTAAIWPSATAAGGYGAWKTGAGAQPMHGPASLSIYTDRVFVRTRGQTISWNVDATFVIGRNGMCMVYDDGAGAVAAWAGDSSPLTLALTGYGVGRLNTLNGLTTVFGEICLTPGRFRIVVVQSSGGRAEFRFNGATNYFADGITYRVPSGAALMPYFGECNEGGKHHYRRMRFEFGINMPAMNPWLFYGSNNEFSLEACEWIFEAQTTTLTQPLIGARENGGLTGSIYRVIANRITGLPAPIKIFGNIGTINSGTVISCVAESCDGFDTSGTVLGLGLLGRPAGSNVAYMLLNNIGPKRGMTYEANDGYVQWWPSLDFPTYSALLPDLSAWSLRFRYFANTSSGLFLARPFTIWKHCLRVEEAGLNQVTIELLVDPTNGTAITGGHLALQVAFVGATSNEMKFASSANHAAAALASSTASWAMGSTYSSYAKRKIVLTLPEDIKVNTEIDVMLMAARPAPAADQFVFVNPEVVLA